MSEKRDPVTLLQQADLLDYLLSRLSPSADGRAVLTISMEIDRQQVADLEGLARRVRLMGHYQEDIENLIKWGRR